MSKPVLITVGDPEGCGPLLLQEAYLQGVLPPDLIVYGLRGLAPPHLRVVEVEGSTPGELSFRAVERACQDMLAGHGSVLITLPVSKRKWRLAGIPYAGHTAYLRAQVGGELVMCMLWEQLVLSAITDHVPLARVVEELTVERTLHVLKSTWAFLRELGATPQQIALLGVNPHAGEEGALGSEEHSVLIPAMRLARNIGISVDGPFPADSFWAAGRWREWGAVVACYHDQAFIPFKMLAGWRGVHLTLGLPFWRLSPVHGTAEHLVRSGGKPDPTSFFDCLRLAERLRHSLPPTLHS